jgi:hypothetical protein
MRTQIPIPTLRILTSILYCITLYTHCIIYTTKKKGCNKKCIEKIIDVVAMEHRER